MTTKKLFGRSAATVLLLSCLTSYSEDRSGFVTLDSGLQYKIIQPAKDTSSPRPRQGDKVTVHYTGWLESNNKKFDSSHDRDRPFSFAIGRNQVIKGWEVGLRLMRVGEKRTFIFPPNLGYGAAGARNVIPGNATLIFEIELLSIE